LIVNVGDEDKPDEEWVHSSVQASSLWPLVVDIEKDAREHLNTSYHSAVHTFDPKGMKIKSSKKNQSKNYQRKGKKGKK
jgi:hypothetical protein